MGRVANQTVVPTDGGGHEHGCSLALHGGAAHSAVRDIGRARAVPTRAARLAAFSRTNSAVGRCRPRDAAGDPW